MAAEVLVLCLLDPASEVAHGFGIGGALEDPEDCDHGDHDRDDDK
jgi:hypothetical protein